jgi:hypothetical protein
VQAPDHGQRKERSLIDSSDPWRVAVQPVPPTQRFEFDFAPRYERAAGAFGITRANSWVEVGEGRLEARYGRWRVSTELENVSSAQITGPYRFIKTAGPPRLGVSDLGLTFASNGRRGVLICFSRRVPGIDPLAILRHGELTVTVSEPEGLVAALRAATAQP